MSNVLAYGFPLDGNFGGPSVVHGLRDVLCRLYPGHQLVVYQHRKVDPVSVSDLDFPVWSYPYRKQPVRFYAHWLLQKLFGRLPRSESRARFWRDYRAADVVVNIHAICFCSQIHTYMSAPTRWKALAVFLRTLGPSLVARIDGKASVKSTSSYGPICDGGERLLARLACGLAHVRILARERESRRQLMDVARVRREVRVAPDIANAWRMERVTRVPGRIGFSVSFQSEMQCECHGMDYVGFMRDLVSHAIGIGGQEVVLLPNQLNHKDGRTDVDVAEAIRAALPPDAPVTVFDALHVPSTALRNAIASCEMMVSCRYHACVAAFASGVPTLIIGWHVKYSELARWYGQERWIFRQEDCRTDVVREKMEELWNDRRRISAEICDRHVQVDAAVVDSVRYLLGI